LTEDEQELEEPTVADTPEPDQEPHEPFPDEADEEEAEEETPPSESEGAADDADVEKAFKALANESTRHANRISAIMGPDAQMLVPCPRCVTTDPQRPSTPGFIWPHEVVPLLPADKAAVKLSIGEGVEPEYLKAQDAGRCGQCDGFGKVDTGSQVPTERYLKCLNCQGRGWTGSRQGASLPVTPNGAGEFEAAVVVGNEPPPGADPWGRLPDDPKFGVLPGYER